jgi:hypothetical protein
LAQALGAWPGVVAARCVTAVAWAARSYRWPMRGKVDDASTKRVRGTCRARRIVPRLTEAVTRRGGDRVGDGWQRSGGGGWLVRASSDLASSL